MSIAKPYSLLKYIETTTSGIYYKQFKELIDYLWSLKNRNNYIIFCKEAIFDKTKEIADYFNIEIKKSKYLGDSLFIVVDRRKFEFYKYK